MRSGRGGRSGFTLIEFIIVITLTGIIAVLVSRNITRPVEGFIDLGRRAELVDNAELALRRMAREISLALPNSLRITDGVTQNLASCTATAAGGNSCAVELLRTSDGGRYRRLPDGSAGPCGSPGLDRIRFTVSSDCFEVLGNLTTIPAAAGGADQDDCLAGTVDCLVIYNTGQAGANAYNADNIAGIQVATADSITFEIAGAAGVTRFPLPSPRQRFQIVDMPVSFVCNPGAGMITRRADYAIVPLQSINPAPPGVALTGKVTACSFTYSQGTNSRNALLLAAITLGTSDTQGNLNEVRIVEQIHVPNIP